MRGRQARARGDTDKACPQQSGEPPVFGSGRNHPRPRNGARAACSPRCQLSFPRSLSHAAHVGRGPDADVVGSNQALRSMGRPQLEAGPGLRGGATVTRGGHAAGNRSLLVLRLCHVPDARLPTCLHLRQTRPEIREICCPLLRCSTCACWGVAKPCVQWGALQVWGADIHGRYGGVCSLCRLVFLWHATTLGAGRARQLC